MPALLARLIELIYPQRCAFCAAPDSRGVCRRCEAALPRRKHPGRVPGVSADCAVPCLYDGAVRRAMLRFKFRGRRSAAAGFGALIARCAAEELSGRFDCVTWVPVSERRRRVRGYDQAYLLARETARLWDAKPVPLLTKCRDTPPQSGLDGAQRRANVLGAFAPAQPERIRGCRVLLIDDVVTTGATLNECVRVLRLAGAESVVCACLASASTESHGSDSENFCQSSYCKVHFMSL